MSSYQVGDGLQQIKMAVDISTFGLAASRAIALKPGTGEPVKAVAHSESASGDIPQQGIGPAIAVAEYTISVMTKIDLLGDDAARKSASGQITAKYIFDDGTEGHTEFSDPIIEVSDDYRTVILYKEIELKS
jgi:hypothetical protein